MECLAGIPSNAQTLNEASILVMGFPEKGAFTTGSQPSVPDQ